MVCKIVTFACRFLQYWPPCSYVSVSLTVSLLCTTKHQLSCLYFSFGHGKIFSLKQTLFHVHKHTKKVRKWLTMRVRRQRRLCVFFRKKKKKRISNKKKKNSWGEKQIRSGRTGITFALLYSYSELLKRQIVF